MRLLHLSHALLLAAVVVATAAAVPEAEAAEGDKAKAAGVALMHNRLELNSLSFEELDAIFREGTIDVRSFIGEDVFFLVGWVYVIDGGLRSSILPPDPPAHLTTHHTNTNTKINAGGPAGGLQLRLCQDQRAPAHAARGTH